MERKIEIEYQKMQVNKTQADLHLLILQRIVDKKNLILIVKLANRTKQDITYDMAEISVKSKTKYKVKNDKNYKYDNYNMLTKDTIKSNGFIIGCIVLETEKDIKTRVINSPRTKFKDKIVTEEKILVSMKKGVDPREKYKNIKFK